MIEQFKDFFNKVIYIKGGVMRSPVPSRRQLGGGGGVGGSGGPPLLGGGPPSLNPINSFNAARNYSSHSKIISNIQGVQ